MPRASKYCPHRDASGQQCTTLIRGDVRSCPDHSSRWPTDGRTKRTTTPEHHVWASQVLINADYRCQIRYADTCTGHADQADHIRAVAEGGLEYDPANGQATCQPCHVAKSSDEGHRAQGHRVPERARV